MLPTLLPDLGIKLIVSQQRIHTREYSTQVWPARHDLDVVDFKALTGLSLLWVPHFCVRHGASLKDLNPNTTSMSKVKCYLVSQWNIRKHTNIDKPLELRGVRVIYRVEQITHRVITINKMGQVIVTMHASKLKTKQEQNISELWLKVYKER
jgi:hypothetical protein